jgi:hypothetical protein
MIAFAWGLLIGYLIGTVVGFYVSEYDRKLKNDNR